VTATLEIGDPVIAFLDITDRTPFRKLSCVVATLWGSYYNSIWNSKTKHVEISMEKG
jgi:hypothetical protein